MEWAKALQLFLNRSSLQRYPQRNKELLQAWDSADELILQYLSKMELKGKKILILNDHFGALTCALSDLEVTAYTDSFVSFQSIQRNIQNLNHPLFRLIHQLNDLEGIYDLVLIRIPKNQSFLEDILCHISHHLHSESQIVCGVMIKHLAPQSFTLLNQYIGPTHTSLAQKKARLLFSSFKGKQSESPYPLQIEIKSFETPILNHSNLFSREKLDIGTRFFLDHIPKGNYKTILDLGCGNGLLGITAKKMNPSAQIIFSDESQMAIQSAMANFNHLFPSEREQPIFKWTHCFENEAPCSVDLVLCNPPFHQGHSLNNGIAQQMFRDSQRVLTQEGVLRVIGNSHLNYPLILSKWFRKTKIVARNNKFTVTDAVK